MLAKLLALVLCTATSALADTPTFSSVSNAKEICELEVIDFQAVERPERFHGNFIRDIDLSLQIRSTIRGKLDPGRIIKIKDIQAKVASQLVRAPLDIHPTTSWGNGRAYGDFIKGQRYLVIGSLENGEKAITHGCARLEYDELVATEVKAVLGIEGKSLKDDVEECTPLRITALLAKICHKDDKEAIRQQTEQIAKLIKKCRKSNLVELTDRLSGSLIGETFDSEFPAAKRRLFLLSLVETLERLDAEEIKDIRSSRLQALIARHKKEGPLKIRMEEIREVAPNPSVKVIGRLHDWIPE
jgi:hypothetical protein